MIKGFVIPATDAQGRIVKRCAECRQRKPAMLAYFPLAGLNYASTCHECEARKQRRVSVENANPAVMKM